MAINKDERRFLRHWEEQRKGSKLGYYALYILIWFFTSMLCLFFVFNNFMNFGKTSINTLYLITGLSIIIAVGCTHLTWYRNEKQFKKIIDREVMNSNIN